MKIIKWSSEKLGSHEILLDDEDFEKFGAYNWTVEKPTNGSAFYAKRKYTFALNKRKSIALHRAILGITDVSVFIDHVDGNGLNNQKANLRIATHRDNKRNAGKQKNNTTGYKGVYRIKNALNDTYRVAMYIRDGSKRRHICSKIYKTPEEAARKYNELAKQYHGEFAYQNPVTAIKYADGTMYFVSPYRKRT
jgi:hypothetical protein